MVKAYFRFELDKSDKRIDRLTFENVRSLDTELKKIGCSVLEGSGRLCGASESLIVGTEESSARIIMIMRNLSLPYVYKELYYEK